MDLSGLHGEIQKKMRGSKSKFDVTYNSARSIRVAQHCKTPESNNPLPQLRQRWISCYERLECRCNAHWANWQDPGKFPSTPRDHRDNRGRSRQKVLSGTRNPRFRDEATLFECFRFVVKEVDDMVGDFWWETWMIWIGHRDPVKKADRSFDTGFEYVHLVA